MRGRRLLAALMAALMAAALSACRGGGLVFKGTHESQDRALLEKLSERYPDMSFTCAGRSEGAVHDIEAADGTVFPAWTAPAARGEFQVLEYYLEEWLFAQGYYDQVEALLEASGYGFEYHDYNHYPRHLELLLGDLDGPGDIEAAARTMDSVKELFDGYLARFMEGTGSAADNCWYNVKYRLKGGEHFTQMELSRREGSVWDQPFSWDDYESVLKDAIENIDKSPKI